MRRFWTLLLTAMFGFLLALLGQHAAQAASGDGVITGTVTGNGQPLASSWVYVYQSDSQWSWSYSAYTGSDGKFTFRNVPDGSYKVRYDAPYNSTFLTEWYNDKANWEGATPVTVTNGSTVTADASLTVGGRVTGRVTADQGGAALSGASVYVYDAANQYGGSKASGHVGPDGSYTTSALPTGRYKVQFNAPYPSRYLGEWYDNKQNWNNANEITVTAGADTTANAGLATGSLIKGTVTAQTGGQPVTNTYVSVYDANTNSVNVAWASVGTDGKYTTGALPDGDYKVQFNSYGNGYLGEWFDDQASFADATVLRLRAGEDATADARLAQGSHITGQVTAPDGSPVAAFVSVESRNNSWSASTDAAGRYDISGLPRGRYTVQFRPNTPTEFVREWWNDQRDADSATPIVLGTEQTFTADARLERGGVITGTVRDPQSQPVAGATVRAQGMQTRGSTVVTDANGQYRITGLEAGDYKVRIKPIGDYAGQWYQGVDTSDRAALIRVGLGETRSGIDATLRLTRTIGGTVVGADGLPVADARVEVYARGATYYADATHTDASGAFRTHDLPPGTYQVQIRPAAPTLWASEWYNNASTRASSTSVTITQNQSPTISVALRQGGRIRGTLTKADGTPLAGADVEARSNREYRYAETDAQGRYEITGLNNGEYTVSFWASGFLPEWYNDAADEDSATPVQVTVGQASAGIDAQLVRGGSISGTVRANGVPLTSSVWVSIYSEGSQWEWDEVYASQGQYSFQGLPPGDYKVYVSGDGQYAGQWWPNAQDRETATPIHVNAGQDVTGRDFALTKGATISGTVNGPDGNPLQWGYVYAYTTDDEYPAVYGYVQQGRFQLMGLRAGTYRLQFQGQGLLSEWWQDQPTYEAATPITVVNGQVLTGIDVQLAQGAKIRGIVRDGQGDPLEACVSVRRSVDDRSVGNSCTDSSGRYAVTGLPAGRYVVRFDADSRAFATQWWNGAARRSSATVIDLAGGSEAVADATMLRGGTLTGLITDQENKPVGGVQVRASSDDDYEYGVTDSLGRYTFTGLDDGDYRIEAIPGAARLDLLKEWYNNASTRETATVVPVGNGQTVTASMQLEQGALVSGVVTDADGPVAGIGVDVFDLNGNKSLTAWTDADGRYTSSALAAGEYKVRFMPGYYGGEGLVEQWWEGRSTEATARIVYLNAHEQKTGVNARLRSVGNATAPGAPTSVTATAGDEQVVLQWQAPASDGGLPVTRYRVEGDPGGGCQTLGTLHCTIEGLENGQSYTFRVWASNSVGLSPASAASAPTVPFGKPKPPTAVTATAGEGSATVTWTAGSANGRPITSYTVTASPGGRTCTSATTSCTVNGLTAGTSYTFTVTALNEAGRSQPSDPSSAVTPTGQPVAPPPPGGTPAPPPGAPGTPPPSGSTPVAPPTGVSPELAAPPAPGKGKLSVKKRKLRLTWAGSPGATSYRVLVAPASKPGKGKWKTVSTPSFQSGKLKKGKYVVQVKAVGPGGQSAASRWTFKVK